MTPKEVRDSINALGIEIAVSSTGDRDDYISLTDIAKYKSDEPKDVIKNWMRSRSTLEYLCVWEELHNPGFNRVEIDPLLSSAGSNSFTMSPQKWISTMNAIGMKQRIGRNGGTFAHVDIAFEFASWISPEFKLYVIKDYQRLKSDENSRLSLEWNQRRDFARINYRIHTDAIKEHVEPFAEGEAARFVYATEADVLNVALFGKTAKQWRDEHPDSRGNIRDEATLRQLIVLANLESMNAELIKNGLSRPERAAYLRTMAVQQLEALRGNATIRRIEGGEPPLLASADE